MALVSGESLLRLYPSGFGGWYPLKGKSSIGKTLGGGFGIFLSALLAMRGGCKICCDVMVIMAKIRGFGASGCGLGMRQR